MKISELECPSCGGKLKISENNPSMAVCEYCNSQYAIEWDKDQAYFDRGINYTTPKKPENEKAGGWGLSGRMGGILAMALVAILVILMNVPAISGRSGKGKVSGTEEAAAIRGDLQDRMENAREQEPETEAEGAEVSLTGALGEMASAAFEKPVEEISEEELSRILWIETEYSGDSFRVGYSFQNPMQEEGELSWLTFPRDADPGRECLCLFTGIKKLSIAHRPDREDMAGLRPESMGGYFSSPSEAADILEDAGAVKELRLNAGAESLEGLSRFPNLEILYLNYSELSDIRELAQLSGLKSLTLDGFPALKDFSVLGTMGDLEELSLEAENLKTLDFLQGMKSLKSLKIADGSMLSLDGLEKRPELEVLILEDCEELKSMEAVEGLTALRELSLDLPYDCKEPDLSSLAGVEKLGLSWFDDCSFLSGMTGLKELTLDGCDISAGVDLSGLTKLKKLTCHSFAATGQEIGFITDFTSLEELDLKGISTYEDISGIFNMKTLKKLDISGMECEIAFERIEENSELISLSMDGLTLYNNVKIDGGGGIVYVDWDDVILDEHTEFLGRLKGLKNLSIRENNLTDLAFARQLVTLERIDLSDNYITDLRPLAGLKALDEVICAGNPISNDRVLDEKIHLITE